MSLKLTVKPNEKVILGGAVISCGDHKADLIIHNDVPILREKDVMTEIDANTVCKKLYLILQTMYIDPINASTYQKTFFQLVDLLKANVPSSMILLIPLQEHLMNGNYYRAMKSCQDLIKYEEELIND